MCVRSRRLIPARVTARRSAKEAARSSGRGDVEPGDRINAGAESARTLVRTSFAKLKPAIVNCRTTNSVGTIGPLQTFTGIWFDTISDESSFDGMVCWQISRPGPTNIVALEVFLQTQDK